VFETCQGRGSLSLVSVVCVVGTDHSFREVLSSVVCGGMIVKLDKEEALAHWILLRYGGNR